MREKRIINVVERTFSDGETGYRMYTVSRRKPKKSQTENGEPEITLSAVSESWLGDVTAGSRSTIPLSVGEVTKLIEILTRLLKRKKPRRAIDIWFCNCGNE